MPSLRYIAVSRVKYINTLIFEKPFDFLLFTNRLGPTAIARKANVERRKPQQLIPNNASDNNTQNTYPRLRQTTGSSRTLLY